MPPPTNQERKYTLTNIEPTWDVELANFTVSVSVSGETKQKDVLHKQNEVQEALTGISEDGRAVLRFWDGS